jgi:hypothetical protein
MKTNVPFVMRSDRYLTPLRDAKEKPSFQVIPN